MKKFLLLSFFTVVFSACSLGDSVQENSSKISPQELQATLEEFSQTPEFDAIIAKGIDQYVQNQQADQQKAQADRDKQAAERAKNVKGLGAQDHVWGNPEAKFVLFEYSDFECPFCERFHTTAKEVVENSNGQVAWVYRHWPLPSHSGAPKKAEASECVAKLGGNNAFWTFTDALFAKGTRFPVEDLASLAQEAGVSATEFQSCLDSGEMSPKVENDTQEGIAAGVSGTPGNIVLNTETGEVRVLPGAVGTAVVEAAIKELQ